MIYHPSLKINVPVATYFILEGDINSRFIIQTKLGFKSCDSLAIINIEIDMAPDDADKRDYNVIFSKAKEKLNFEPKIGIQQGIREIYSALKSGTVDTGPKTVTVSWYRNILEAKNLIDAVTLDGRVI